MSGRQGSADFLFEIRHRAQCHRHAEYGLDDFLGATYADAVAAGEIGERRCQTRSNAVSANLGGNGGVRHMPTTGTGAGMGLIFHDLQRDRRNLDGLKSLRLRISGPRLTR